MIIWGKKALKEDTTKSRFSYVPFYCTGFFSLSSQVMIGFLIPLWAIQLGASPLLIGISVAAGSFLPSIFAISAGAVIDLLGPKRILFFCSLLTAFLSILYPSLPFIFALIILQLLVGSAQTFHWIASQAYAAKLGRESAGTSYTSKFSFAVNLGTFVGPLLIGVLWDYYGPWSSFLAVSLWSLCLWISSICLPPEISGLVKNTHTNWRDFFPRWSKYHQAFSLLYIPMVFFVMYGTFLRLAGTSIQNSFYLVYLEQLNFSATAIAIIFAFMPLTSIFSSLLAYQLSRVFGDHQLLMVAGVLSILPLSLSPLFEKIWQFIALAFFTGLGVGVSLPLLISLLARAVGPDEQGLAIGLRTTMNRLSFLSIPFIFGVLVQGIGLNLSFFLIGVLLLLPMAVIVPILSHNIRKNDESTEV